MKKTLLFLSLIFVACKTDNKENTKSTSVNPDKSKMPTGLEEQNLKGKVKKVIEYHYNAQLKNGQYIKSEYPFYTITSIFDENGNSTEYELADYQGKTKTRTQKYLCNIVNDSTQTETMYLNGKRTNKHVTTWINSYTQTDSLFIFLTPEDSIGTAEVVKQSKFDSTYRTIEYLVIWDNDNPESIYAQPRKINYYYNGDTTLSTMDDEPKRHDVEFTKIVSVDSHGNKTQEVSTTVGSDYHYVTEYKYEYYQ